MIASGSDYVTIQVAASQHAPICGCVAAWKQKAMHGDMAEHNLVWKPLTCVACNPISIKVVQLGIPGPPLSIVPRHLHVAELLTRPINDGMRFVMNARMHWRSNYHRCLHQYLVLCLILGSEKYSANPRNQNSLILPFRLCRAIFPDYLHSQVRCISLSVPCSCAQVPRRVYRCICWMDARLSRCDSFIDHGRATRSLSGVCQQLSSLGCAWRYVWCR
jgi:hypothetical protein